MIYFRFSLLRWDLLSPGFTVVSVLLSFMDLFCCIVPFFRSAFMFGISVRFLRSV